MSKKISKNSINRMFQTCGILDPIYKIDKVRTKFGKGNMVKVDDEIKIEYGALNAYVYVNDNKYLRISCGNHPLVRVGTMVSSSFLSGFSLGLFKKVSIVEILPPDKTVHTKEYYKNIENKIIDFYPEYKKEIEEESAKKWKTNNKISKEKKEEAIKLMQEAKESRMNK